MHVLGTVERVHTHYERLWWTILRNRWHDVLPQRQDALLREVIPKLVQYGIKLYVRCLVNPWAGRGVRRLARRIHSAGIVERREFATEEMPCNAILKQHTAIVQTGFLEGGTGDWKRSVGQESAFGVCAEACSAIYVIV
jgi:hypothetical protein